MAKFKTLAHHMSDLTFGLIYDSDGNSRSMLMEVLTDISRNAPKIHKESSINRALIVAEAYNIVYGLVKVESYKPLALVANNELETNDDLSSWDLRIDQYSRLRIGENFNISIIEFMNLSRRFISKLITAAEIIEAAHEAKTLETQRKLEQQALANQQALLQQSHNNKMAFAHSMPGIKK